MVVGDSLAWGKLLAYIRSSKYCHEIVFRRNNKNLIHSISIDLEATRNNSQRIIIDFDFDSDQALLILAM